MSDKFAQTPVFGFCEVAYLGIGIRIKPYNDLF